MNDQEWEQHDLEPAVQFREINPAADLYEALGTLVRVLTVLLLGFGALGLIALAAIEVGWLAG